MTRTSLHLSALLPFVVAGVAHAQPFGPIKPPTGRSAVVKVRRQAPITMRIARAIDAAAMARMVDHAKTINHGWYTLDASGAKAPESPNFSELDRKDLAYVVWSDNDRPGGDYRSFTQQNPGWKAFVDFTLGASLK